MAPTRILQERSRERLERTAASGADADAVDAREAADAAEPDAETTAGPRLTVSSAGRGGD
jgi:hypothetical protein